MDEEKVVAQPAAPADPKAALMSMIFGIISVVISWGWIVGGIAGIVLSCISFGMQKKSLGVTEKPHAVFRRVAKPLAIVGLLLSIASIITYTIVLIGAVVAAIKGAAA